MTKAPVKAGARRKKILIFEINGYLCPIVSTMKNLHIILALLLVSIVVLYR
jgi:hypothetical protein